MRGRALRLVRMGQGEQLPELAGLTPGWRFRAAGGSEARSGSRSPTPLQPFPTARAVSRLRTQLSGQPNEPLPAVGLDLARQRRHLLLVSVLTATRGGEAVAQTGVAQSGVEPANAYGQPEGLPGSRRASESTAARKRHRGRGQRVGSRAVLRPRTNPDVRLFGHH